MGAGSSLGSTDLRVEFADADKRLILGTKLQIECASVMVKEESDLPDYEPESYPGWQIPSLERTNADYYRELVSFVKNARLLRKVALTVTNTGALSAHTIRVEFVVHDPERKWEFCDSYEYRDRPPQKRDSGFNMPMGRSAFANREPDCDIDYLDGDWHLSFDFRDLQPKRTLQPGVAFYAGCRSSETLALNGRIFAAELPGGGKCELTLTAATRTIETDLDAIERAIQSAVKAAG